MTKTRWGPRKGEIDGRIEVKNERFFVGVASLLQGRLNCVARGESVLCFIILLDVAPLRSGLNMVKVCRERLHYVIYNMAASLTLMTGGLSGGCGSLYSLKHR